MASQDKQKLIINMAAKAHAAEVEMLSSIKAIHGEEVYLAACTSCEMFKTTSNLLAFIGATFPCDQRTEQTMRLLERGCNSTHAAASVLLLRLALKGKTETEIQGVCNIMVRVNESHVAFLEYAIPAEYGDD